MTVNRSTRKAWMKFALPFAAVLAAAPAMTGRAAGEPDPAAPAPTSSPALDFEMPSTQVEMKATELGVRFTPGMARAIASQLSRQMQSEYTLTDEQTRECREIVGRNLMKLAQDTQRAGRESIELLMESMIANDGNMPRADAQRWAKVSRPVVEDVKKFMMTTASQCGKVMTLSQRLKLTAEMAAVSAGFVVFEERMNRWEQGGAPEFANPFFEGGRGERRSAPSADGSEERAELRRARQRAERRMEWETGVERRWNEYVEAAITYYGFDEKQTTSARAIVRQALEQARAVRTDEWQERFKLNRTTASLSQRLPRAAREGPWMWQLDREYEELLKPLQEIGRDLRARIDDLADSAQRERARSGSRDELGRTGLSLPPA